MVIDRKGSTFITEIPELPIFFFSKIFNIALKKAPDVAEGSFESKVDWMGPFFPIISDLLQLQFLKSVHWAICKGYRFSMIPSIYFWIFKCFIKKFSHPMILQHYSHVLQTNKVTRRKSQVYTTQIMFFLSSDSRVHNASIVILDINV